MKRQPDLLTSAAEPPGGDPLSVSGHELADDS